MQQFVSRKDQHMAEIRWALKTVRSHYSFNSAQDITDVFRAMFPDSNIAKCMSCGATKTVISYHFWDCTFLQARASDGCESNTLLCDII